MVARNLIARIAFFFVSVLLDHVFYFIFGLDWLFKLNDLAVAKMGLLHNSQRQGIVASKF